MSIKLDHIFFPLRQQRRIIFASTESRQWLLPSPGRRASSDGGAVLRPVRFNPAQLCRMALEILLCVDPRQIHLFQHH